MYHPYVCKFIELLNSEGVDGLMKRKVQIAQPDQYFEAEYAPTNWPFAPVQSPYPKDGS